MIPSSFIVSIPYLAGMVGFALTDSVEAAIITAIIAGIFSIVNTVLNGTVFKKVTRIESKTNRLFELHGERENDKPSRESGRNPESEKPVLKLEKDRRDA